MSLFDLTTDEAKEAVNVKQGFVPAKPGINFFELTKIDLKDDLSSLSFSFKGTRKEELGNFTCWFNDTDFDYEDDASKRMAEWKRNQLVHIVKAFLTDDEMQPISGVPHPDLGSFLRAIVKTLTPNKFEGVEAQIKLLIHHADKIDEKTGSYKTNLPLFPKFISTEIRPFALALNTKINPKNNEPYERITPLSESGVTGTTEAPSTGFGSDSVNDVPFPADFGS